MEAVALRQAHESQLEELDVEYKEKQLLFCVQDFGKWPSDQVSLRHEAYLPNRPDWYGRCLRRHTCTRASPARGAALTPAASHTQRAAGSCRKSSRLTTSFSSIPSCGWGDGQPILAGHRTRHLAGRPVAQAAHPPASFLCCRTISAQWAAHEGFHPWKVQHRRGAGGLFSRGSDRNAPWRCDS